MNPYLFTSNKKINLTQYLPDYIQRSEDIEIVEYIKVYEDYMNNMYKGEPGVVYDYTQVDDIDITFANESFYVQNVSIINDPLTNEEIEIWNNTQGNTATYIQNVSARQQAEIPEVDTPLGTTYIWSSTVTPGENIGILEMIHRLIDLVDGTMVPDHILYETQNQLGYDKSTQLMNYNNYGNNPSLRYYDPEAYADNPDDLVSERIRFMTDSLPQWYTQKLTNRGLKILLFAVNIIGNVATEYTKNYSTNPIDWDNIDLKISSTTGEGSRNIIYEDYGEFLAGSQPGEDRAEWYPTPHFNIWIDLNATSQYVDYDVLFGNGQNSLSNILANTRPINTVYEGIISLFSTRNQYYYNYIQYESATIHSYCEV